MFGMRLLSVCLHHCHSTILVLNAVHRHEMSCHAMKKVGVDISATAPVESEDCTPSKRIIFNMNNLEQTSRVDVRDDGVIKWVAGGRW